MHVRRPLAAIAAAAAAAALVAGPVTSPGSAATVEDMPTSGSTQLTVMTANLIEMWNAPDLNENLDMVHFAARVRSVLTALSTPAPDVVVLQEVTAESAATVAAQLTSRTGRTYAVGVNAASGAGAIESNPATGPLVRRETAILYNTETVTLSSPAASLIGYPESQIQDGEWLSLRQATALVTKRSGGKKFAIYGAHFQTHNKVLDHDLYGGIWGDFLKRRISEIPAYAGATPVIAGDFNRRPCINETDPTLASSGYMTGCTGAPGEELSGLWTAMTTSTTDGPGAYVAARPSTEGAPDNIFTTGTVVSTNRDYDYKAYGTGETRFPNGDDFLTCHYLYNGGNGYTGGEGSSSTADAIPGCAERYYSDHVFVWATIQ